MRTLAYAVFNVIEANNIYIVIIKHLKMLFWDAFEHVALFASRLAQENILMIFYKPNTTVYIESGVNFTPLFICHITDCIQLTQCF